MSEVWDAEIFNDDNLLNNSIDIDSIWNSPDFLDFFEITDVQDVLREDFRSEDKTDEASLISHDPFTTELDYLTSNDVLDIDSNSDILYPSDDNIITSTTNKHHNSSHDDDIQHLSSRLGGNLRDIPRLLSDAINSGDIGAVKVIIDDNFESHCAVKVPAVDSEYIGREYVYYLFDTLLQAFPDFVFVTKKVRITSKTVACRMNYTGTKAITAQREYLFKPSHCNLVDEILKSKKIKADEEIILRQMESVMHSEGKRFLLWGGGYLMMTYDSQSMKITRFEMNMKISSFKESHIVL